MARAVVEPSRDIESLPLASLPALACDVSVGDFVRGQMWEYPSDMLCDPCGEFGKASVCIGAITKGRLPIKIAM